jgi:hypothetical protein
MATQPTRLPQIKSRKRNASVSVPVTADNFIPAETDKTFDAVRERGRILYLQALPRANATRWLQLDARRLARWQALTPATEIGCRETRGNPL